MSAPSVKELLDYTGKVVIVTGSGSGLGAGIALRFGEAGARVVVHYHSSSSGAAAVVDSLHQQGREAIAVAADLGSDSGAQTLTDAAMTAFGRVDVLINNAGIYPRASVLDMTPTEWDAVINANLRSVFLSTQAVAKVMIAQGGGVVVNITSIEADNPAPDHSHYNASKAGVAMFTRSAAAELGRDGVRVNAVAPGLIWREGIEQAWADGVDRWLRRAPLGRLGMADDVADACLFLASPAARWITGVSLTVDGGVMTSQIF